MASSVQPKFGVEGGRGLRISYGCAEAITAGQLVERRTGTRLVGVAAAGSLVVAGVAQWDVPVTRVGLNGAQVGDGLELNVIRDCVIAVTFAAAATVGQGLICAANGQVTPAGATPDARTVIGEAFEAASAGAVGLAFIY